MFMISSTEYSIEIPNKFSLLEVKLQLNNFLLKCSYLIIGLIEKHISYSNIFNWQALHMVSYL